MKSSNFNVFLGLIPDYDYDGPHKLQNVNVTLS